MSHQDSNDDSRAENQQGFGLKKSRFTSSGSSLIPDAATFDYVTNGQNLKVPFGDLKDQLGATGTIVSTAGGTPILDQAGSVNTIRSVSDGPGILSTINASNQLELRENLTADATGAAVLRKLTAESVIRSLVAGTGINIGASGNTIQISAVAGGAVSVKTVLIAQISDFPAPVGGVITLEDDTDYQILNDLSTANRFVWGNRCQVRGVGSVIINLTYTGTGDMFTCVDCETRLNDITVTCASGTYLNASGTGSGIYSMQNASVIAGTLGSVADISVLNVLTCRFNYTTDGFAFSGSIDTLNVDNVEVTMGGGTAFALGTAVFTVVNLANGNAIFASPATYLSGAAASANIATGGQGSLANIRFAGTGTALNTITVNDSRWFFLRNNLLQDTRTDGLLSMNGNATETVITSANVPVLVAGTFVVERASQMTGTTAGRLTYNGEKNQPMPMVASVSMHMATGGAKNVAVYVAINGTFIAASISRDNVAGTADTTVAAVWQQLFTPNDFVEVFVENQSDTTNIVVDDFVLLVN